MKSAGFQPRQSVQRAAEPAWSVMKSVRSTLLAALCAVGLAFMPAGCSASRSGSAADAHTVLSMATWIIDRLLGELDYSNLEQNIQRIDRDLEVVQRMVSSLNDELGTRVKSVREQLAKKVDRQDVPRLVKEELQKLRGDLEAFEARLGSFKLDVAALEEKFGYLPTELATPVVYSGPSEGQPEVHPLTKEWAELLSRFEQNRLDLVEKRRYYEEQADEVTALTKTQEQLVREASELHAKAVTAIREKLQRRQEMRRTGKRTTHSDIRDFDREIASLAWVVAVTFPQQSGPERGRLGVPKQLVSPQASEVMHALKLSGVSPAAIRSLYRRLVDDLPAGCAPDVSLPEPLKPLAEQAETLFRQASVTLNEAHGIDSRLGKLLEDSSPASEAVGNEVKRKQQLLDDRLPRINDQADRQLNQALDAYIDQVAKNIRPVHVAMRDFTLRVLRPLARLVHDTECVNWNSPTERNTTWQRFLQARQITVLHSLSPGAYHVAFSPDGKLLATRSGLWELPSGRLVRKFASDLPDGARAAFSPNGRLLFLWDRLMDVETGQTLRRLKVANGAANGAVFSPDNNFLALCYGSSPTVWEIETGRQTTDIPFHHLIAHNTLLYRDGKTGYSSPDGRVLTRWDPYNRYDQYEVWLDIAGISVQRRRIMLDSRLRCFGFSPDGRYLATVSDDERVRVWDVDRGDCIASDYVCMRDSSKVDARYVEFGPGGDCLAATSDREVRIWRSVASWLRCIKDDATKPGRAPTTGEEKKQ